MKHEQGLGCKKQKKKKMNAMDDMHDTALLWQKIYFETTKQKKTCKYQIL